MQYARALLIETRAVEGVKRYKFRASSTGVARDGASIPSDEWRTDAYMRNPIVLWSHDYMSMPIGRAVALERDADGLVAEIEYDADDPRAQDVMRKLDAGYLHAVSVGFRGALERGPDSMIFRDVELLEISNVAVPSDPNALAMRSMADDNPLTESLYREVARLESRIESLEAQRGEAGGEIAPEATDQDIVIDPSLFDTLRRYLT